MKMMSEDPPIYPAAMQIMVTSALTTALFAHFSHANILLGFPTMSALIGNPMDIDPVPAPSMTSDHQLSASPSSSPTNGAAMSMPGSNKWKIHSVIHSAPSSVILAAHSAPSSFNTLSLSDPSSNLHLAMCVRRLHHQQLLLHLLAASEGIW